MLYFFLSTHQLFFEELAVYPARTTVAISDLPSDALIEIDCIAYKQVR